MTAAGSLLDSLAPVPSEGARAERGRAWLGTHDLPDRREEAWRYTPLDDIIAALESARPAPEVFDAVDRSVVDEVAGDHGGPRLVFVNGVFVADLSDLDGLVEGLLLGGADRLRQRQRPGEPSPYDEPVDGFQALNWAAGRDVAAVMTEPGASPEAPVHVVHLALPGDGVIAVHPRTVVRLASGSHLQVIETFAGIGGRSITNASTRIVADEDTSISYQRVMTEPADAIHVGRTGIEQAARSTVRTMSVITGGEITRNAIDVHLGGDGARVDLDGLYLPTDHQRHDNVITVDHAASRCTSTQRFKGIIDDHGRGSFSGHVIVRPGTVGTDASQSNPNLVLARTAQADTRPWLEILADDVACTHGATVGRLDDEALFYLRSRGIPLDQARALLIAAFAGEIIDEITPASLRDRISAIFDQRPIGSSR